MVSCFSAGTTPFPRFGNPTLMRYRMTPPRLPARNPSLRHCTRTMYYVVHGTPAQRFPLRSSRPFGTFEAAQLHAKRLAQHGSSGWILEDDRHRLRHRHVQVQGVGLGACARRAVLAGWRLVEGAEVVDAAPLLGPAVFLRLLGVPRLVGRLQRHRTTEPPHQPQPHADQYGVEQQRQQFVAGSEEWTWLAVGAGDREGVVTAHPQRRQDGGDEAVPGGAQ